MTCTTSASAGTTRLREVARALEKIIPGTKIELASGVSTITKTEFDIDACLDNTRIQEEFGYVPEYDLEKGLGGPGCVGERRHVHVTGRTADRAMQATMRPSRCKVDS